MLSKKDRFAFGFSKDVDTKYIKTYQYLKSKVKLDGIIRNTNSLKEAYLKSPGNQSHASFIEQLPDGTLLIAWFTGECEGVSDVSIVISRLNPDTIIWSSPQLVSHIPYRSNQNPVLYYDKVIDKVRLYHTSQVARDSPIVSKTDTRLYGGQLSSQIVEIISKDNKGTSWNLPRIVFNKLGSFLRDRIVPINDDEFILPHYMTSGKKDTHYSVIKHYSYKTNTWKSNNIPDSKKLVQPSIVKYDDTCLRAFFRNRDSKIKRICYMDSKDLGKTWNKPIISKLVNGNCGLSTCLLKNGQLLIIFTNSNKGSIRTPLSIAISNDMGITFSAIKDVMPFDVNPPHVYYEAEFSYPSILQTPDEKIHITYTYNRITIGYLSFDMDWLLNKAPDTVGVSRI